MKNIPSKSRIIQFGSLLISNYSIIIISFITNIFMTNSMNETEFGYYKYVISIITMCVSLLHGGFHYSAARLIARSESDDRTQKIMSVTALIMISISFIFSISALLGVNLVNNIFFKVDNSVFWAVSLVYTLLLQQMFTTMLKGNNKVNDIIIQTMLPQLLLFFIYLFYWYMNYKINHKISLIIFGIVYLIVDIITWIRLKLNIPNHLKLIYKDILKENKGNGFQLYKGSLIGVFVADFITVIVGSLVSKASYGMYALAMSMSAPISAIPQVMATIKYKDNSMSSRLSKKNIIITVVTSLSGVIILNLAVNLLFPILYDEGYLNSLNYLFICSITYLVHGMGDYFNQFCAAHGKGHLLKKGAYIVGITQLFCAAILVPHFGLWGLIFAKLASSITYLSCMIYFYKRLTQSILVGGNKN